MLEKMESNNPTTSFEQFIKEQSDEFRMYPSKRVWNSVYNNLHPGRRWPSISMCIVLLTTLLLVGYLNSNTRSHNNIENTAHNATASNQTSNFLLNPFADSPSNITAINSQSVNQSITFSTFNNTKAVEGNNNKSVNSNRFKKIASTQFYKKANSTNNINSIYSNKGSNSTMPPDISTPISVSITADKSNSKKYISAPQPSLIETENEPQWNSSKVVKNDLDAIPMPVSPSAKKSLTETSLSVSVITASSNIPQNKNIISETDKSWIENYALYNRPVAKKWKGRVDWQAYITPSIVYRNLHNNAAGKYTGNNLQVRYNNNIDVNRAVKQSPSLGLETGIALKYQLSKVLKISGGVQLNYTSYSIHAFDNGHPNTTSLTMYNNKNDLLYEVSKSTPYSNYSGLEAANLHNRTFQFSIPMGLDLKLAGNDNVEWYAGTTIQPTYVIAGKSYLISSDARNYVKDNSMLNHFNMNAGFETYLSIKKSGYTLQVGPQFRSQLFSTNKLYSIQERVQTFGLKIGISKKL